MDIEVEEVYGSDVWTRVGPVHGDAILYDDAGTWKGDVKIDIHEVLDGFLQTREDSPTIGATTPAIADNTNLQYRVIYAERFTAIGEVVIGAITQTAAYRVLKGGMDYRDFPALWDLENAFYGVTDKPFNSFQPVVRKVTAEEEHFLHFLTDYSLIGVNEFKVHATIYFTNGTTHTPPPSGTPDQEQWETYIYPVGFNALGLDAYITSVNIPYKYTVKIVGSGVGGITTEIRTFWLEESSRQDRFFMYENSVQGWNTLRTNGEHRAMPTTQKTEAKKALQKGYGATDANVVQKAMAIQMVLK